VNIDNLFQKPFLTFQEAIQFTGLSKSHLYKLTSKGLIPHSKPTGKLIFFERIKLEEWLRQNTCEGLTQAQLEKLEQQASAYVMTGKKGDQQ
jgi:excisionase family DNA binding protein